MNRKIFVLLPDGVGLRNFVFTQFRDFGMKKGFEVVYWNNTVFDLSNLGFKEVKIEKSKCHPLTDLLKTAKVQIDLNLNIKRENDKVYDSYRFPFSYNGLKNSLKSIAIQFIILFFSSEKDIRRIRKIIASKEKTTTYYQDCIKTLEKEKPAMVFCTNQRITLAVAPILAAQDLGIPTATFIFSWDNLPKATMVVETDYYFVWSEYMKAELLLYYPYIKTEQVFVTGTPQFEPHFDKSLLRDKKEFFNQHGLDLKKKYICFSGDDITTSPDDEKYLEDVAIAVELLNVKGSNLGIIFRRCPVDFSNRYNSVLKRYSDVIVPINPLWNQSGTTWNTVMPTAEDIALQVNIIYNSEMVVNIASSMVFDFVAFNKPCLYINYDVKDKRRQDWSSKNVYNFIHFRSMPTKDSVFWINDPKEIADIIEKMLGEDSKKIVTNAQLWFEKINQHPAEMASVRIWNAIDEIITK